MFLKKENELDFACQTCGNCCRSFNINLTHLDIERILENRPDLTVNDIVSFSPSEKDDPESFISTYGKRQITLKKQTGKDECIFLENNICSIHAFKPRVCKVWPFSLEKGDKITWIKEHRSFIKKLCKHISVPGANDPEELIALLKQHYRERKLFSKIVTKWNNEKKELLDQNEMFLDIYDEDFLNFILKEMNIREISEEELNKEDEILSKIINTLIKDRKVSAITESQLETMASDDRNPDLVLNVYIQEAAFSSFFNKNNLESLKTNLEAELYIHDKKSDKISFFLNDIFLDLQIKPFLELKNTLNYDTKIIYNPYSIEISVNELYDQTRQELIETYNLFWFKILKLIKYIEKDNFIDAKFLYNSIVNKEFSAVIYWLNQKKFVLDDIPLLNYKPDNLSDFMKDFGNIQNISELKVSTERLINLFNASWQITGLETNSRIEDKVKLNLEKIKE